MPISDQSIVGSVMDSRPETVAVFLRNRMHCPGCVMARFMTLAEAAQSHGVAVDALVSDLRAEMSDGQESVR